MENTLLLKNAFKGVRSKHFPRSQIILFQGDQPHEVMFLKTGVIKMYDIDDQGNEKILHLLKPGSILPFAFFSGKTDAIHWFYSALTDCDVYVVPYDYLTEKMKADSELALLLIHWFSTEVHELLSRMSSLGKTNAHDKLKAALTYLAMHHATLRRSGWRRVLFPVSHQLLADMTGITRESAAMTMKTMKDDVIIRQPRATILEINLNKLSKSN